MHTSKRYKVGTGSVTKSHDLSDKPRLTFEVECSTVFIEEQSSLIEGVRHATDDR